MDSLDDISWFDFHPGVVHYFTGLDDPEPDAIPSADVFFGYAPPDRMQARYGLPVVLIQGYGMLGKELESYAFEAPCPKVCVAEWLIDVGVDEFGGDRSHFVHIPSGIPHDRFMVKRPIAARGRLVAMLHHEHISKGTRVGLEALQLVRDRFDDVEFVAFGTTEPTGDLPEWLQFHHDPTSTQLVDSIYNNASIYVCPSHVEGFGLSSVEAMACGAALVTTDNGGSRDYALDGATALVSPTGDAAALADNIARLVEADDERIRLAEAGTEYVARYDWTSAAEKMERFLLEYMADPAAWSGDADGEFDSRRRTNYR